MITETNRVEAPRAHKGRSSLGHLGSLILPLTSSCRPATPPWPRQRNRKPAARPYKLCIRYVFTVSAILHSLFLSASASEGHAAARDSRLAPGTVSTVPESKNAVTSTAKPYQQKLPDYQQNIFSMDYDEVANISSEEWRNFSCQSMQVR